MSFARHARCKPRSFPRKACPELVEGRESTPQTFRNVLSTDWIPAFAGMTGGSSGFPFQITPVPDHGARFRESPTVNERRKDD